MKQRSVLLVDDEPIILKSLSRELTSDDRKLNVALAANGAEAIAKINSNSFDLVVTDLLMSGIDGFQVLKAAKRKDVHTMAIILTGYADLDSSIDTLRLGADDFLQKPCNTGELLYRMSNCFAKQDLLRKVDPSENITPICSYCKKIRDEQAGAQSQDCWYSFEEYFNKVKKISFTHGCCPDCFDEVMQDDSFM